MGIIMAKIKVLDLEISVVQDDYISLTDIAKYKNLQDANEIIRNWLRNRNTIEFLGIWERIHNDNFKPIEFDGFRKKAGLTSFVLSSGKWIKDIILNVKLLMLNWKYFER